MIARFIAEGSQAPAGSLAVDGLVPGTAMIYSHWQGAPDTPADLLADTSTEMLLRAAANPGRWLDPYPVVAIGHLDADGLLAAATAVRPALARHHGGLLADAAACGDFQTWRGERAYALVLALHRRIHAGPTPQAVLDGVIADLETLLNTPGEDPGIAVARSAIAAIQDGRIRLSQQANLATIAWEQNLGHAWDPFLTVGAADDLPLHVLGGFLGDNVFQLRIEHVPGGVHAGLDAPRHSWARTVIRPAVAWPDMTELAAVLQREEPGACRWLVRPAATARGYTCLLATDETPSGLDPERIRAAIAELLAGR